MTGPADELENPSLVHESRQPLALLILALLVFGIHVSWYRQVSVDDAYIVFRYAGNFARGLGLVYNPGERVEGTSSILWTLWISLGIKVGLDPLFFAQASGVLLGAATLVYLSRRTHPLVSLCTACSGVFAHWCIAGLETPLFTLGLVVALGELYAKHLVVAAACFGVLPWIRPDGLYFTVLVWAPILTLYWREPQAERPLTWKRIVGLAALVVVPYAMLLLWRVSYYGDPQPNTYYAKVAMPWYEGFWEQLEVQGVPYVTAFWSRHLGLLLLGAASMALAAWRRRTFLIVLHIALILYQAYFVFVGGDWMAQFRWYAPIIPIYLALIVAMLAVPVKPKWDRFRPVWVLLGVGTLGAGLLYQSVFGFIQGGLLRYNAKHELFVRRLGEQLRVDSPFSQSVLLGDIGRIGYESDQGVIDAAGLTDRHMARIPAIHFWKRDLPYLLSRDAEWVVIRFQYYRYVPGAGTMREFKEALAAQPDSVLFTPELWLELAGAGRWMFEQQLLASPVFHSRYSTVFVSPEFDQPSYTAVFCRRDVCDSEMAKRLRSWSPNLGHVKAELRRPDADQYLQRTMKLLDNEETAAVAYARRVGDRALLRSVAANWQAPPWNRIGAYTGLGLEEYKEKEFDAALRDFKAVIELGGNQSYQVSNVGWALRALGREEEAQKWFEKSKGK